MLSQILLYSDIDVAPEHTFCHAVASIALFTSVRLHARSAWSRCLAVLLTVTWCAVLSTSILLTYPNKVFLFAFFRSPC